MLKPKEQVKKIVKHSKQRLQLIKNRPFLTEKASDFLHGRKGPWPQPSPAHPMGEAAAVIHLPWQENLDWWMWIGSRYLGTLLYTPVALAEGILNPGLKPVSDEEFHDFLTNTMLSKFITPKLDERDKKNFAEVMEDGKSYFIVDLMCVNVVHPFEGIYLSGTKTLLEEVGENQFKVICIWVEKSQDIFHKTDGDAWELAKYYVLQGGAIGATLVIHPILHFPLDSINAVTKTVLPKNHILFKLIYPHLRFTLPLENAVLTFKSSILQNRKWMAYAPYPGREGLRDLLVESYLGIDGNDSYPPYQYPLEPQKIYSKYGEFHERYYQEFYQYVSKVLANVTSEDYYVAQWAKHISRHVPGFPNEEEIFKDDTLIKAVAYYLFAVSVAHTVDHYNYGEMDIRKVPLRLRQSPPRKGLQLKPLEKLCSPIDLCKYKMAQILFYRPTSITLLKDTQYDFDDPNLRAYAQEFLESLKILDSKLEEEGIQYIPLDKIARSIQS